MRQSLFRHGSLAAVALAAVFNLSAQVTTATFYGLVADPSGAAIAAASVTLTNEATGHERRQDSSAVGEFSFQFLEPGKYALRIQSVGFKSYEAKGLDLASGQNFRRNYTLDLGAITDRITVTSEAPMLNAASSEQRESISSTQVTELPVARRTLSNLMGLSAGIAPGAAAGMFVFNGNAFKAGSYTMDGIDASGDQKQGSANFGNSYISVVSLEAVEEVQVVKGVFSAEYSRTQAGNVNVVTKSGTNQYHGSLFSLFNSEELQARNPFLTSVPGSTFNQFGGSLGGPILRNRLFFFGSYEGYRERAFRTIQGAVPTQQLRDDAIRAVPAYKPYLDGFPLPNQPTPAGALTGQYFGADSFKSNDNHMVIRSDYWLSDRMRINGTWVRDRPDSLTPRLHVIDAQSFRGQGDRVAAAFITIGATWNTETRIGYNSNKQATANAFFSLMDPNKAESTFGGRRYPTFGGLGFSENPEATELGAPQWTFAHKTIFNIGRHTLKVGGGVFAPMMQLGNLGSPTFTYPNLAALLANSPSAAAFSFGRRKFRATAKEIGFFVQDDWRVSSKLTLNLGIRWDGFSRWTAESAEKAGQPPFLYNPDGILDDKFTIGKMRDPKDPYEPDFMNLGPRFGFAYDPTGKGKTVVRGGFGVMLNPVIGDATLGAILNDPLTPVRATLSQAEVTRFGIKFPYYNEDVLPLVQGGIAVPSYKIVNPQIEAPYTMNFSLSVQRALTGSLMLETGFVGNRRVKQFMQRNYNNVDRLTGLRPNPAIATSTYFDNSDSLHYTSWQSSLRKRYSKNLIANVHYTWAKTLTFGTGGLGGGNLQDFHSIASNRGRSEFDVKHIMTIDSVYMLPMLNSAKTPTRLLLGGWQVAGIFVANSGRPMNVGNPGSLADQRVDALGIDPYIQDRGNTLQYLNPKAFAAVPLVAASGAPARAGTLGNYALNGPGFWRVDASIGKNFRITEGTTASFRAEMFNALNNTTYTSVNTNIQAVQFGSFTAAGDARRIQLNLRLRF